MANADRYIEEKLRKNRQGGPKKNLEEKKAPAAKKKKEKEKAPKAAPKPKAGNLWPDSRNPSRRKKRTLSRRLPPSRRLRPSLRRMGT